MHKEGMIRNFLGTIDVFAVGAGQSLDGSRESMRTLYYRYDSKKPAQEIDFGEKPLLVSDRKSLLQTDGVVFEYHPLSRVTLPGESIVTEKLTNPQEENSTSYLAEIVPGLKNNSLTELKEFDKDIQHAVLSDLLTYYPKTVITQGNVIEVCLSDGSRPLVDSPNFLYPQRIEGFAKSHLETNDGVSVWKIAKAYPLKEEHEKAVLVFGLEYSLPENDKDAVNKRGDEFVRAMELGGEDAREMLAKIARPSIEIRKQSLYDESSL